MPRTPAIERVYRHVEHRPDGCLEWVGAVDNHGLPVIANDEGRIVYAHRVVWEAEHGPLGRRLIYRTCGNRLCVDLEHLALGRATPARPGTVADSVARTGRCPKGHDDLYRRPDGTVVYCRECAYEKRRARHWDRPR